MLSTQEDMLLPTKYSKDTNNLLEEEDTPEDKHVAMSTAENEYIEMANNILATSIHRPRAKSVGIKAAGLHTGEIFFWQA